MVHLNGSESIPESIQPELEAQIKVVGRLRDKNFEAGYDGGFQTT